MASSSDTSDTVTLTVAARGSGADTESLRPATAPVLPPGTLIGRHVIVDRIGAGGMGTVYAAFDTQLARRIAIKVLRAEARTPDAQARLLREAQAMARLTHRNVLTVYDVGAFGSGVFIAMEFVDGQNLRGWLRDGHPWKEALAVVKEAGRGLAAAHEAGIVHRDFKPENVLIGKDGRVVVADFGIARALGPSATGDPSGVSLASGPPPATEASASSVEATTGATGDSLPPVSAPLGTPMTETGAIIGTVGYMAPERAFEDRDDPRTDQFSFGVTLYRALYAQAPFAYADLQTYLKALLDPPRPPPAGTPVPSWVHDVVKRALSYEAGQRFGSMTELLAALERDPTRRRRAWFLGACAVALAGAGGVAVVRHQQAVREECRAGERIIAESFDAATQAKVEAAIGAAPVPHAADVAARATRVIKQWSADWAKTHREALEATRLRGEQSVATMNDRVACLDAAREEMTSLVAIFSRADRRVAVHAINAAYGLPRPRACLDANVAHTSLVLPDAPDARARVIALRHKVAEVNQLDVATKFDEAIALGTPALAEARAIPHRRSEAELLLAMGDAKRQLGDPQGATAVLQDALAAAEAAGDDSLAGALAAKLAFELGDVLEKPHDAERWLALARGILEREGGHDERVEGELLESELAVSAAEGHPDQTIPLRDRLIALLVRMYGPTHPRVAASINNKACDLYALGRLEEAVAEFRRGIAMQEELFGPDTPTLSADWNNVGASLTLLGRYDEAQAALERSRKLLEPIDLHSANAIVTLATIAVLENREGRTDDALAETAQGIAIVEATGDNGIRFLPSLLVERGRALLAKDDAESARQACARALAVQEKQEVVGPEQVYSDDALTCLGDAETRLGRLDEALAHLERGLTLTKRDTPTDMALARFAMAKALRAAKREPERAQELASEALEALRGAAGMERAARAVAAWVERK
jgi:tetratricopeptide (TPR) repeat protein/predicted Ser/Thr protein kinase